MNEDDVYTADFYENDLDMYTANLSQHTNANQVQYNIFMETGMSNKSEKNFEAQFKTHNSWRAELQYENKIS
jgi:hypothetical protein